MSVCAGLCRRGGVRWLLRESFGGEEFVNSVAELLEEGSPNSVLDYIFYRQLWKNCT